MNRSISLFFLALLMSTPGLPMGGAPAGLNILVVPSEPNMVRVGMDMVDRERVLLMSYAPASDPGDPFLHVWDGSAWLRVPSSRYADGSFLKTTPAKVMVVGGDRPVTRALIEQAVPWSPEVLNIAPNTITDLINSLGKLFQFSRGDWKWFAAEYDLTFENLNQGKAQQSWYDSHTPGDIPPAESPFRKKQPPRDGVAPLEPMSLPPLIDSPVPPQQPVEEEVEEPVSVEDASPAPETTEPEAFSLDVDAP